MVEETGVPGKKTDLSQVADKLYRMIYRVDLAMSGFVVICNDSTASFKSNYHTITTTETPELYMNGYSFLSWNICLGMFFILRISCLGSVVFQLLNF